MPFYRYFPVTTTADAGPGSLRSAIDAVNGQCDGVDAPPCKIAFQIDGPPPSDGWFTIEPASPMPRILARYVAVDGATQTALTGDTNPLGPEIFLDGHGISGDGVSIQAATMTVRGVAIGGFGGSGILAEQHATLTENLYENPPLFERNYLGTDPTGTRAVPNGARGLMALISGARIRGNVMSHNLRSGMFLNSWYGEVRDNRVEANGASGIYLGFGTDMVVENNVIANNREFGVAIATQGRMEVYANTIAGNGAGGLDIGLDGPTINDDTPRIVTAHFDGTDTIIEGTILRLLPGPSYRKTKSIFLYANREVDEKGFAEGEEFLGRVLADAAGHFSLRVPGDLRGRWIDATSLVVTDFGDAIYRQSSEFGPPLRVE